MKKVTAIIVTLMALLTAYELDSLSCIDLRQLR